MIHYNDFLEIVLQYYEHHALRRVTKAEQRLSHSASLSAPAINTSTTTTSSKPRGTGTGEGIGYDVGDTTPRGIIRRKRRGKDTYRYHTSHDDDDDYDDLIDSQVMTDSDSNNSWY